MLKSGLAFHVHHDRLYELCFDYDERVDYIKANKPESEQKLRLRLLQLIPDELIPGKDSLEWAACNKAWEAYNKARAACDKAWEAYDKARKAYNKAREACDKAWEAYDKAREAYDKAWEAYDKVYSEDIKKLHKKLCPNCPFDNKTIFSKKEVKNA